MQSLDARLKALEAQQQAKPRPGGAWRIYRWCMANGFPDVPPPPDGPDMPTRDYTKLLPIAVLKAILDTRERLVSALVSPKSDERTPLPTVTPTPASPAHAPGRGASRYLQKVALPMGALA